jgi:hypothetical protein
MTTMGEMLAAITARQSGESPAFEMPLKDAQRDELAIIREQMTDRCRPEMFVQWDEVTQIHRTGSIVADAMSRAVFVFWRYIEADEAFRRFEIMGMQGNIAALFAATPDCLIAWLSSEGLRFEIADSALLVRAKRDDLDVRTATIPHGGNVT